MNIITVERKILEKNENIAQSNRKILTGKGIVTLDMLSSPGSGKTTILEKTLEKISDQIRIGVIEGDVHTDNDARRIAKCGVPVVQIITHGSCHIEAQLVRNSMDQLPLDDIDLLIIENVGNLVCPAEFDLGETQKIVILSTTEGDDKPLKYPLAFRVAKTCILNKIDLLPYLNFQVETFKKNALKINPDLKFFELSAQTGEGMEKWIQWLRQQGKSSEKK